MEERLHIMLGVRHDRMKDLDVEHTTPQVGVNFQVKPGLHFYVSYSESFVPNTMVDETTGDIYDPEQGEGFDVGFKFELFDRKLVGTFAYFEIEKSNVVLFNARRDPGEPEFILSGLARNEGVELDVVYTANENLQVIFAWANHDARELENAQFPDQTGLRLQGSSKNSIGLWTKYKVLDGRLAGLSFGGGVEYKEGPINLFPNGSNRDLKQDSYTVVDLFAKYAIPLENDRELSLSVNLKNVTDEIYMNKNGWWADPFNWVVSAKYTF
jgi:iron complex outermembrane receptor protein